MPGLYGVEAETAEVARALQAQKTCEAEHGPPTTPSTERWPDMTADHGSYDELARARRGGPGYREGYAEAQRAYLIGQAVRGRRLVLGLSPVELASRAGMTQPASPAWKQAASSPPSPCLSGSPPRSTPASSSRSPHAQPDQLPAALPDANL